MSLLVVVLLAGLWLSILLPGTLRGRRGSSPMNSIDSFERSMGMLALRSTTPLQPGLRIGKSPVAGRHVLILHDPGTIARSGPRTQVLRRRRMVLRRLIAAVAATVVPALVFGGAWWAPFALAGTALCGYVALLVHLAGRAAEARSKVRVLHRPVPSHVQPVQSGERWARRVQRG
jgi:hypothetical protein